MQQAGKVFRGFSVSLADLSADVLQWIGEDWSSYTGPTARLHGEKGNIILKGAGLDRVALTLMLLGCHSGKSSQGGDAGVCVNTCGVPH
ncbi:hypothetical protein E2C01_062129 [Portunus trituberculatus]|uniref:Uncharacterized protein n=1 Tax=Portunus trituberculatus TaxID=210409 RepID=A0A5B7HA52_PORTR|nr:hypothetical protein [Portunus trituberculatus]